MLASIQIGTIGRHPFMPCQKAGIGMNEGETYGSNVDGARRGRQLRRVSRTGRGGGGLESVGSPRQAWSGSTAIDRAVSDCRATSQAGNRGFRRIPGLAFCQRNPGRRLDRDLLTGQSPLLDRQGHWPCRAPPGVGRARHAAGAQGAMASPGTAARQPGLQRQEQFGLDLDCSRCRPTRQPRYRRC